MSDFCTHHAIYSMIPRLSTGSGTVRGLVVGGVMVQNKSLSFLLHLQLLGPKVADFCPLQAGAVFTAPARSVGEYQHPRAPRYQVSR